MCAPFTSAYLCPPLPTSTYVHSPPPPPTATAHRAPQAAGANPQTDKLADQLGFPQSYSEMVLGLVNKCRHSEADNDPNYINCFETALEKHMVSCAVEKCLAPATNCAKTACRMDGVL